MSCFCHRILDKSENYSFRGVNQEKKGIFAVLRRAVVIFEVLRANLSLNSKKFYVRDKEITRKMGACPGAVLVSDTDFCPGRKLERTTL